MDTLDIPGKPCLNCDGIEYQPLRLINTDPMIVTCTDSLSVVGRLMLRCAQCGTALTIRLELNGHE